MNTEVKVGAFTLLGLILIVGIMAFLGDFHLGGEKEYRIQVGFSQAIGLSAGCDVCYAGVKVGSVESVVPAGAGVEATLAIQEGTKIPRKSTFGITSNGVMGAKFINISPAPDADMGDVLQPGDFVLGAAEAGMDGLMNNLNKAMDKVQVLLDNMNAIMGDKEMQAAIKDISLNMKQITANIDHLSASMDQMVSENRSDVRQMTQNLNRMTGSLMRTADSLEVLVSTFNGNGETGANLREAVDNLTDTSRRIDRMATALEGVVTDPQVADDLKATLHNVRNVTGRADKMLGKISQIEVDANLETMYSGKLNNWQTDLGVDVRPDKNSLLRMGLNDIGEGNRIDFQGGFYSGAFGARAGIIDSKAGLGVDLGNKKLKLSVDGYDPNSFRLKSRLQYEVAPDTYIFTQVNDINHADKRATYFGVRRSF